MSASHLEFQREGHLETLFRVFSYLQENHNPRFLLDPTYPEIDHDRFKKHNWVEFYGDVKEEIPTDMPEPRGKERGLEDEH